MDKQTLLDRISKKEQQIEKLNKKIKKLENQCTEEEISIADSFRDNYSKFATYCRQYNLGTSFTPMSELRSAYSDLDEATTTLNKYKNQLNNIIDKESTEKVEIFVEFLNRYKTEIIKYVEKNIDLVTKYYRLNNEYCEFYNSRNSIIRSGEMTEDEWKTELKRKKIKEEDLQDSINPLLFEVYDNRQDNKINYEELNEILDKEIEAKYWNMVERVTKVTGEIIDASDLSIGGDGNINGIIIGKEGKAKLETILAGGYNQNIIVNTRRGQVLHYRLIVNKIK